jgi:protein-L-isoaspartate(D-aspartate) O-methyltransferase
MAAVKMDMEQARFNMIEQQIRPWEVLDPEVLGHPGGGQARRLRSGGAQGAGVCRPRVADRQRADDAAAEDRGAHSPGSRQSGTPTSCFEVGTGSGYMAALLASKAEYVYSVEIDPLLAEKAPGVTLQQTGVANVSVETGDASQGWSGHAPYDVIVISGSLPELPEAFCSNSRSAAASRHSSASRR